MRPLPFATGIALIACTAVAATARGATRVDIGAFVTALGPVEGPANHDTLTGFGARLGFNLNKAVALELEVASFGEDALLVLGSSGRSRLLALAGVRVGFRRQRVGLFGKARAGLLRTTARLVTFPPAEADSRDFALDLGASGEVYLAPRLLVRLDLGDTWVPDGGFFVRGHNPQVSVGVGLRL